MATLATPASRSPALAPGRLTAGELAHSASVAISVPRSQASACQSAGRPRRSATAWAAAKVSQIGPQRRNRCLASGEGSSWPEHPQGRRRRRDRGAAERQIEADHEAVGEAQRLLERHRASFSEGKASRLGEIDRRDQDCNEVPPAEEPLRLHPGAFRRVLALPERRRPLHRRPPRRGRFPHRRGAGQESEHLVLDGGALLPGPRLRGVPGAAAGGDRGVPDDDRHRRRAGRRGRCSPSTTPSWRPRSAPTTRTSRKPRAS